MSYWASPRISHSTGSITLTSPLLHPQSLPQAIRGFQHGRHYAAVAGDGETHDSRFGPVVKFQDLAERQIVNERVIQTLTRKMGLETMTPVQSLTINEALKGVDV